MHPSITEKLAVLSLDDESTMTILEMLEVQTVHDITCFSEYDLVDAGMKLFTARKLLRFVEVSVQSTAKPSRPISYRENIGPQGPTQQQQEKEKAFEERKPFLGSGGIGQKPKRLSQLPPKRLTVSQTPPINFEKKVSSRDNELPDPGISSPSTSYHEKIGSPSMPGTYEKKDSVSHLKKRHSARSSIKKPHSVSRHQHATRRQSTFTRTLVPTYEYNQYTSLHPSDHAPIINTKNKLQRGSSLDGNDASSLLNHNVPSNQNRRFRESMENVTALDIGPPEYQFEQEQQRQLTMDAAECMVEEADAHFEEASFAYQQQQIEASLSSCFKAVALYERICNNSSSFPQKAHTAYTLLTDLLRRTNQIDDAEKNAKRLVKLEKFHSGPDHLLTADAMFTLGRIQLIMEKLDHAAYALGESLRIQLGQDKEHPRTGSGFYYLALVFQVQHRYEKALPCFAEAVRVFKGSHGAEHSDTAEALHGFATVLYKQGNLDRAKTSFFKTLTIKLTVYGKNHVSTADTLFNVSMVLRDQGNIQEAVKYGMRASRVLVEVFGESHGRALEATSHLAHLQELLLSSGDLTAEEERQGLQNNAVEL